MLMNLAMMVVLLIVPEVMVVIIMIGEMLEDQEIQETIVIEKIVNIPVKGNIEIVPVEALEATMIDTTETAETEVTEEEEVQITIMNVEEETQMIHEDQAHHTTRVETEDKREKEIEEVLIMELRLIMTDRDLGAEIDDI